MAALVTATAVGIVPDRVANAAIEHKAKVRGQVDVIIIERAGVAGVIVTCRLAVGAERIRLRTDPIRRRISVIDAVFVAIVVGGFIVTGANAGKIINQHAASLEVYGSYVDKVIARSQVIKEIAPCAAGDRCGDRAIHARDITRQVERDGNALDRAVDRAVEVAILVEIMPDQVTNCHPLADTDQGDVVVIFVAVGIVQFVVGDRPIVGGITVGL